MANLLDVMLRRHVAPVLAGSGFVKSGRTYRLRSERGDYLVVNVQAWPLRRGIVSFFVNVGIVVGTRVEWFYRDQDEADRKAAGIENSLIQFRALPPAGLERGLEDSPMDDLWGFPEDTGGEECGRVLAGLLAEEIVPTMRPLLDRRRLLDVVRDPSALPYHVFGLMSPRERNEILLLVDEGSSRELEEALRIVEAEDRQDMVAVWARQRLERRAAEGD